MRCVVASSTHPTGSKTSSLSKDEDRLAELQPVAIMQGLGSRDGLAIEPGRPLRGQVAVEVALGSCLDFGVLAGDAGIAEDADLGAFVQAKTATLVCQQVDAALLASALHLDPGPAQGLLDQGKE